jgi:pimeloyl-ACP methyl ester carboxylesterase
MQVIVDGLLTNYQTSGKGKTVLMLHGWADSHATYKELTSAMDSSYKVVALDLPGFGGSQAPPAAWGLANYTDFVEAFLKKLGINKLYAAVGHSFGGSIVIAGVAENKLNPEKVVLIGSAGIRNEQSFKRTAIKLSAKAAKIPLALLPSSKSEKIKKKFYARAGSDVMLLPHMRDTFATIVRQDVRVLAHKVRQPVLLIYGQHDNQTPVRYGELLSQNLKNSNLKIIPEGDHFVHQGCAPQVNELVKDFLK